MILSESSGFSVWSLISQADLDIFSVHGTNLDHEATTSKKLRIWKF